MPQIRRFIKIIARLLFLFPIAMPSTSMADEIVLKNGDRLTGKVLNLKNKILYFSTDYSKKLKIDFDKIQKINTDDPVEIQLSNGWVVKGNINPTQNGLVAVKTGKGNEGAWINWEKVVAINPKSEDKRNWKGSIDAGATHQSGNVERVNASLGGEAELKMDNNAFDFRFLSIYSEDNGEVNSRNTSGHLGFKHWFSKNWYGSFNADGYKDRFRNLNLRLSVGPGVGYQFWDTDEKKLDVEVGITYFSEDLKTGQDKQYATARMASQYFYQIHETLKVSNKWVVFPNLDNIGDYILRNEAAIHQKINKHFSLKFSHILDYNNEPDVGIKKADSYTIFGLQYDF